LPLNLRLEALFNGRNIRDIKQCEVCGSVLHLGGNKTKYCKPCALRVHRRQKNKSDRKRRSRTDK
jgi:rRNA maturation endonuclease Nob1